MRNIDLSVTKSYSNSHYTEFSPRRATSVHSALSDKKTNMIARCVYVGFVIGFYGRVVTTRKNRAGASSSEVSLMTFKSHVRIPNGTSKSRVM